MADMNGLLGGMGSGLLNDPLFMIGSGLLGSPSVGQGISRGLQNYYTAQNQLLQQQYLKNQVEEQKRKTQQAQRQAELRQEMAKRMATTQQRVDGPPTASGEVPMGLLTDPDQQQYYSGLLEAYPDVAQEMVKRQIVPQQPDLPTGMRIGPDGKWMYDPNYLAGQQQIRVAGRPQTNIQVGGAEYGTIPQGYQLVRDANGGLSMSPIPGGPVAAEEATAAKQAEMKQRQKETYSDVVVEDIDRALSIVGSNKNSVTGFGSYLSGVPGTPAKDLSALLETIRANVGFDRLQQMRDASPTGGALGQVSEMENKLLQSTLGSLEQSQSSEQFTANLNRLKGIYNMIVHGTPTPDGMKRKRFNPETGRIE